MTSFMQKFGGGIVMKEYELGLLNLKSLNKADKVVKSPCSELDITNVVPLMIRGINRIMIILT